jgi:hypothetical protein
MQQAAIKLNLIQSKLNAPKTLENKFGGYKYRSAESILEALKPHLDDHKAILTLSDEMVEVGGRIYVKATATFSTDGESITTTAFAREAEDKKGMDSAQVTGACSSYARKYALNGLFCIDDTKDADATNDHGKAEPTKPAPTPPPTTPGTTASFDNPVVVEKITSVFWQQTTLAGLNEMMELAKNKGYGTHKDVVAAYDELKTKLT